MNKPTLLSSALLLAFVIMPSPAQADPAEDLNAGLDSLSPLVVQMRVLTLAGGDPCQMVTPGHNDLAFGMDSAFTIGQAKLLEHDEPGLPCDGPQEPCGGQGQPECKSTYCYTDPESTQCRTWEVCQENPEAPICTGDRIDCDGDGPSGEVGWDTDHDGTCNHYDNDDDGDGVPDSCDPTPEATNPVDSTYNWADWVLRGSPASC